MECYATIYDHSTPSVKHVSFRVTRQFCIWSRTVTYVYCFLLIQVTPTVCQSVNCIVNACWAIC